MVGGVVVRGNLIYCNVKISACRRGCDVQLPSNSAAQDGRLQLERRGSNESRSHQLVESGPTVHREFEVGRQRAECAYNLKQSTEVAFG